MHGTTPYLEVTNGLAAKFLPFRKLFKQKFNEHSKLHEQRQA
jgi:hypothetical protein